MQSEYLSFHSSKLTSLLSRWLSSRTLELTLQVSSQCNNEANLTQLGIFDTITADPLLLIYTVIEGNDGYNDIPPDLAREIVRRSVDSSENHRNADPTTAPWLDGTSSASTSCQRYSNVVSQLNIFIQFLNTYHYCITNLCVLPFNQQMLSYLVYNLFYTNTLLLDCVLARCKSVMLHWFIRVINLHNSRTQLLLLMRAV